MNTQRPTRSNNAKSATSHASSVAGPQISSVDTAASPSGGRAASRTGPRLAAKPDTKARPTKPTLGPGAKTGGKAKAQDRKPSWPRACILTGGGDAPGLNAVLRAFVRACEPLGVEVVGSRDGFTSLVEGQPLVPLNRESVRGILPKGGTVLGTSNRGNPFDYPQGKRSVNRSRRVVKRLADEGISCLILIGGDGTLGIGQKLALQGVRVIGIPKTIDNDLRATDRTFGLDTAVGTATWAIDTLHSTAEAHQRVMILEVMGRHAGFIALHAGIAGGADVILMPELPYNVERVAAQVRRRTRLGAPFSIIVIGEGAYPQGGAVNTLQGATVGTPTRLAGAGHELAELLAPRIPHEVRVTVLGHLQRGGSPSPADRILATRFGIRAAELCAAGESNCMVALRGTHIVSVPLNEATSGLHRVDLKGEFVAVARTLGIELGA